MYSTSKARVNNTIITFNAFSMNKVLLYLLS